MPKSVTHRIRSTIKTAECSQSGQPIVTQAAFCSLTLSQALIQQD